MTTIDPYSDQFKDYIKTNDYVLPENYRSAIELIQVHQHPITKSLALQFNILNQDLLNKFPAHGFMMIRKVIESNVIQSIRQEKYIIKDIVGSFILKRKIVDLELIVEPKPKLTFYKGYPYV